MNEKYFTDGHSVRTGNGIYCVATDVPAAADVCNKLNSHDDLLKAMEAVDVHYSGSLDWQPPYLPAVRAALKKAKP